MAKFKTGQSGNPGGRPKDAIKFSELARDHSEAALQVLVKALNSKIEKNRITAANIIIERAYGKPPQEVKGNFDHKIVELALIRKEIPSDELNVGPVNRIADYIIGSPSPSPNTEYPE